MSPMIAAQLIAAGVCFAVGLQHAFVWLRRPGATAHILVAIAALAAGANALVEIGMYSAATVEQYAASVQWSVAFIDLFIGALIWFIVVWTGTARRWLAVVATGVLVAVLVVNFLSPASIVYSTIEGLTPLSLPWGETVATVKGTVSAWKPLGDVPGLLLVFLVVDACIRLWKQGARRRAWVVGLTLGAILPALTFHELLVDVGVLEFPYVLSFAFLTMLLVLSFELAGDVVRSSELAGEVVERERRWRTLLDEVRLLVVGLDDTGRIDFVNPYFVEVSGYDRAEAIGRHFVDLVPEDERPEVEACVRDSLAGVAETPVVCSLRTSEGRRRTIRWTNVTLRDAAGASAGVLRVGADVTDQAAAESARDEAIRELEEFKRQLEEENVFLRQELEVSHGFADIVGESDPLRYVLHRVEQVADTDATVVIEGETGVGKELVARAIHRRSSRSSRPFITVDCGSLPASLIESELFGHEKGAFTGASSMRRGRFELADRGTVFLDEIGDLPLDLQVKLLRVLQEGEVNRIGSSRPKSVDVRVIAATNRNLEEEVEAGRFRDDLFYRIHVYPITVPPLRDRRDDIPRLVQHFLRRHASAMGKDMETVRGTTMHLLTEYDWPGNVRELENVIERAVILSPGPHLTVPPGFGTARTGASPTASIPTDASLPLDVVEKNHIRSVLESTDWRVEGNDGAAARLGLKPSTLRSRMKKHGIRRTP